MEKQQAAREKNVWQNLDQCDSSRTSFSVLPFLCASVPLWLIL
jgi:hypothetical protein